MIKRVIVYILVFSISIFSAVPIVLPQYEEPELISLDLKGMEIRDVLKILSQKSGLNVVADSDVKGKVAVYIKDVDVMEALDIIVSTNELAYEEKGTLIRIMTDKKYEKLHGARFKDRTKTEIAKLNYAKASTIAVALTKMKTRLGKVIADDASNTIVLIDNEESIEEMKDAISEMDAPLVTEIFSLDYARAESIKDKLEKMLSKEVGSIRFDDRTNRVIVKDTQGKIDEMKKVVEAFDEKTREVLIDAQIIQVTLSDKYSYGIDWQDVAQLGDMRLTGSTNLTTSLTGTTPSTLTIATIGGNYTTIINLLETYGRTDVLSRPRITVVDKEEANILVGSKEVYVTSEVTTTSGGTYHTTDHVQFVDVGVRLAVTPEINREGYIKMKIKPEVSNTDSTKTVTLTNPDGSTRTIVPYVTTSETETTVLVKDNTTLVLGGLMKDTITEYRDKVPLLGDIPILGKLFSTKGKGKEKTELVIFLTPYIIEGDRMAREAEFLRDKWKKKAEEAKIERPEAAEFRPVAADKKSKSLKKRQRPLGIKPRHTVEKRAVDVPQVEREVAKTPYEEYYLAIRKEINDAAARQDVSGLSGEVELQFTLDSEGFIIRGPVVLNKPDLKLVRAAVNCVKLTSPFPSFPKNLRKEETEFYVVVRYE